KLSHALSGESAASSISLGNCNRSWRGSNSTDRRPVGKSPSISIDGEPCHILRSLITDKEELTGRIKKAEARVSAGGEWRVLDRSEDASITVKRVRGDIIGVQVRHVHERAGRIQGH